MAKPKGLRMIECKYNYNAWTAQYKDGAYHYSSSLKEYEKPRMTELFHLCGVYHKLGTPYEIYDIDAVHCADDEPCLALSRDVSNAVYEGLREGKAVVMAGGFCNYAVPVAGGIRRALGDRARIGLVWIDAHGDGRIVETAEQAVRFVAFPTSAVTGRTMESFCREVCGLTTPVSGEDVLAGDIHDGYEFYRASFESAGIRRLDEAAFRDEAAWTNAVEELSSKVDALYLSVDADILAAKYIPGYEKEVPGGQEIDVVMRNIRTVMKTGKVCAYSLFCFDFDHYERGGDLTALSAMKLLAAGLESWQELPL